MAMFQAATAPSSKASGTTGQYNVRDDGLYGLDRELAEKAAAKHDPKLEADARAWIEAVLGEPLGDGSFHEVLKSGVALCNLVRAIQPDIIKPPSKMAAPFKQMENIGNYLSACTSLGMAAHDSFQTVDLFEGKNMNAVTGQIHRLGSIAAGRGFSGPSLGVKMATENKREFTEAQLREAQATQTFLGKGSHGTPGSEMKTSELLGSEIVKTNIESKGQIAGLGKNAEATFLGGGAAIDISDTVKEHVASVPTPPPAAPVAAAPPPLPPSANPEGAAPAKTPPSGNATGSYAQASAAADMPSSGKGQYVSQQERDARMAADGGKLLYGLDKELADKAAAKYDPKLEAEARAWIEAVLGEPLGDGSFHEVLKSGVVLCNLVRAIEPDIIKPPSKMAAPFKQMENIGNYLSACTKLGAQAHDSFQTVDLYENANLLAVVIQIHALGRLLQKRPGWSGPCLGVKEASANVREFTEEQLQAAKAEQTFLGKGSHGTAGGAMSKIEAGRVQVRGNVAGAEGLGVGGEQTLMGKGSNETPGAQMDLSEHLGNKIVKVDMAGVEGLGKGAEQTFVGAGSSATPGAQMNTAEHLGSNIVKTTTPPS